MPLRFNTPDEARKLVLDESKKWRAALEKSKTQKEGAKDIAATMVAATDVIVSTQVFALDAIAGVQAEQEAMKEGIGKTAEAVDMLAKEHDQIELVVNNSEKEIEAMCKGNEKASAKVCLLYTSPSPRD